MGYLQFNLSWKKAYTKYSVVVQYIQYFPCLSTYARSWKDTSISISDINTLPTKWCKKNISKDNLSHHSVIQPNELSYTAIYVSNCLQLTADKDIIKKMIHK